MKTNYIFISVGSHSCHIAECDTLNTETFEPSWLPHAVPYQYGSPSKCMRYEYVEQWPPNSATNSDHDTIGDDHEVCPADRFNRSYTFRCEDNRFVYKTAELTIVNEVHALELHCFSFEH